jgi:aminoglycoside phosphotransferase (APT) family kinase protein
VLGDAGASALEAALRAWQPRLVFTPALVHGDPNPDNMLVDEGGRLARVIDWEDATAGDPAVDFAGLLRAYGARVTGEVAAAAYGAADPGALLDRAAADAWMADAVDALHALRHSRPDALARTMRSLARRLGVRRSP